MAIKPPTLCLFSGFIGNWMWLGLNLIVPADKISICDLESGPCTNELELINHHRLVGDCSERAEVSNTIVGGSRDNVKPHMA